MLLGSVGAVMRPNEAMGKAKTAAQQAIAIDDTLSEAQHLAGDAAFLGTTGTD